MFILHIKPAGVGDSSEVPATGGTDSSKSPKPKEYKLPSQGQDEWGGVLPSEENGAKKSPIDLVRERLLPKLDLLGFSEDKKNNLLERLANAKSSEGRNIDYYLNDRYVLVKTSSSAEKYNESFNNAMASLNEEPPELAEAINRFFAHEDKETREIRMVMTILTFSASNPKSVLSSLGNLLSSLETPGAKQLAGSSIAEVAAFAVREALKIAKEHPEEAKQILSILGGINPSCSNVDNSCSDIDLGGTGIGIQNGQIEFQPTATTVVTEEKFQVFDLEEGEFVGDEFVFTDTEVEYSCEESCYSTEFALQRVGEGYDVAKEGTYRADQIYKEAQEGKIVEKNALVKLSKIQDQVRNGKDADIRELTPEERASLGSEFNIVA